jgi:hypothetical protein
MNMEEIIRDRGNPVCKNDTRAVVRHYLKFMHTTINAARSRKQVAAAKIFLRKILHEVVGDLNVMRTRVARMSVKLETLEDEAIEYLEKKRFFRAAAFRMLVIMAREELEPERMELAEEEKSLKMAEALLE